MAVNNSLSDLLPDMKQRVMNVIDFLNIHNIPLKLYETRRTGERQKELVEKGYSKTLKSKHLTGEAADFVVNIDGKWSWDYERYKLCYTLYGEIAKYFGLEWGGDWRTFKDYPHIQLRR